MIQSRCDLCGGCHSRSRRRDRNAAKLIADLLSSGAPYAMIYPYLNTRYYRERHDVVNKSLLGLWQRRHCIHNMDNSKAYFHAIAKRTAWHWTRHRVLELPLEDWHRMSGTTRSDEIQRAARLVAELLKRVPEKHRDTYRQW